MALKDINADSEYPYVFMVEQSIYQAKMKNDSETPAYSISLAWTHYKIEVNGDYSYTPSPIQSYYNENFYGLAIDGMQVGDNTHVNTLGAQQLSVKKIIEVESGVTLEAI